MKKVIFVILYFLSPVVLMGVLYLNNPLKYQNSSLLLTMVLGSLGYTWFIWQFVLSARPKFIEKSFGMDMLYRFHGMMAIVAVIVTFIHNLINEEIFGESFMTTLGTIALYTFGVISLITLILMATPAALARLKIVKWIKKVIQAIKFVRYEFLRSIHNLTFIALIFMFLHVLNTSAAKMNKVVFSVYTLYFIAAVLFYLYHKIFKAIILKDYTYIVQKVIQESPNMWTVEFAEPNGNKIHYLPGQFGFFSFKSDSIVEEEHPFSISSGNTVDHMSITVKELGDFTRQIKQLKVGDKVYIDAPYGRFSYMNHIHEKECVFIAGGVGITPMISMLRHMYMFEPNRKVTLIWGMNLLSDYIIKDEIENMLITMPHLTIIPVIANDKEYEGECGYIDLDKLSRLLKEQLSTSSTGYYLCGPPILMDSTLANLEKLGVKDNQIHFERFSL